MPGSVLHGQGVGGEVSRWRLQHPYLHPGKLWEAGVGGCPGGQQDPASCGGVYLGLKVRKGDCHPPLVIHQITIHQLSIPLSLCEFQKIPGKVGKHFPARIRAVRNSLRPHLPLPQPSSGGSSGRSGGEGYADFSTQRLGHSKGPETRPPSLRSLCGPAHTQLLSTGF